MRRILFTILAVSVLAWALALRLQPPAAFNVWTWRDQLILLTGLADYVLMALIMLLSVRPVWLEKR
ncbi:MAG: reductase, partial [Achromobacter mucicolens]